MTIPHSQQYLPDYKGCFPFIESSLIISLVESLNQILPLAEFGYQE